MSNQMRAGGSLQTSLLGNLVGSVAMAYCASSFLCVDPYAAFVGKLAVKKCSLPFTVAFTKGIAANWLVNLAVYMANCAKYVWRLAF